MQVYVVIFGMNQDDDVQIQGVYKNADSAFAESKALNLENDYTDSESYVEIWDLIED